MEFSFMDIIVALRLFSCYICLQELVFLFLLLVSVTSAAWSILVLILFSSSISLGRFSPFVVHMASCRIEDNDQVASHSARNVDHSRSHHDPLPFPVFLYIEWYSKRLDGRRFSAMQRMGDMTKNFILHIEHLQDIAVGASVKGWRSLSWADCLDWYVISLPGYEQSLRSLLQRSRLRSALRRYSRAVTKPSMFELAERSYQTSRLTYSYDWIYIFTTWGYWSCDWDWDLGYCTCVHAYGVLAGWHIVKLFSVPALLQSCQLAAILRCGSV